MRTAALVSLILWVVGSVSGYAAGGAIHLLLLLALLLYLIQRRIEFRAASVQEVSPASILSIVLRREQEDPGQSARDRWSLPSR